MGMAAEAVARRTGARSKTKGVIGGEDVADVDRRRPRST